MEEKFIFFKPKLKIFFLIFCFCISFNVMSQVVPVLFTVNVPDNTPQNDLVFMYYKKSNGFQEILQMTKTAVYSWKITLNLDLNTVVEYKFNRGNWDRVETDINNANIGNRSFTIRPNNCMVGSAVMQWKDLPKTKKITPILSIYNNQPQSCIAISWVTVGGTVNKVLYGINNISENTLNVTDNKPISGDAGTIHIARLNGLQPNTKYKYKVETEGIYLSREYSFTTAPSSNQFMFAISSDSQRSLVQPITDSVNAKKPRFMLHCGDIAEDGGIINQWYEVAQGFGDFLSNNVMAPVYGNHDNQNKMLTQLFQFPDNGSVNSKGYWHSMNYNNVHIIGLDVFASYAVGSEQYNWLINDLQNIGSSTTHVIVYLHTPMYTSPGYHGADENLRKALEKIFIKYGVELVLNGHNHFYERSIVNGIQFVTVAGLTYWLKDPVPGKNPYGIKLEKINHYCKIYINGANLSYEMIRPDGTIGDSYSTTIIPVTGLSISPLSATIGESAAQQLTAIVVPSNASNKNVTWSSSNEAVAIVSENGIVTGISAGQATITATTINGKKTSTCAITVINSAHYRIKNKWQSNTYLKDEGNGKVTYSANPVNTDLRYQWIKESTTGGYVRLKNASTGKYMHIENLLDNVEEGAIQPGWYSAMWTLELTGDGWLRIRNRYKPTDLVHIQNLKSYAERLGANNTWWSAMWQLETVANTLKSVSISEKTKYENTNLKLFPNPVTNKVLNVVMTGFGHNEQITLTFIDFSGRTVAQKVIYSSCTINLDIPSGIYIVNIHSKDYKKVNQLIVK